MNLHSVYKAYKRNPDGILDCPLTFKQIEFYLQVLLPAYRYTIVQNHNEIKNLRSSAEFQKEIDSFFFYDK